MIVIALSGHGSGFAPPRKLAPPNSIADPL
jgi:hypothetical protein